MCDRAWEELLVKQVQNQQVVQPVKGKVNDSRSWRKEAVKKFSIVEQLYRRNMHLQSYNDHYERADVVSLALY